MGKQKIYNPAPKNKIKSNNWQFWAIIALPVIYALVFAIHSHDRNHHCL
ncbi:MAG: hypothetical protein ACLR2E_23005 [Lachnospiraceae bacterium]